MSDPPLEDPYKTLGVTKDCTANDVKKAYRKLVLTCHPDKTGGLPPGMKKEKDEQFHLVQQAHDLLTNPHERQRYDERVQLEELRSELRRDFGKDGRPPPLFKAATFSHKPRSAPNKTPTKSPTGPIFEPRGPPIYETRVPKGVYDDDYPGSRYERPSSRKHEERFDGPPSNPRRNSGRVPDRVPDETRNPERREDDGDFYARKSREKELKAERQASYMDKKKTRTKARRHDSETKRQAFVESESDDSDVERFMGSSPRATEFQRRSEEPIRRGSREERSNARRTQSPSSESDDSRLRMAKDHIRKNNTRAMGEREPRHEKRPSLSKGRSNRTPPPPPPPPPPPAPAETPRRSVARRSTNSKQSKRNLDIVEPSKDFHDEHEYELPRRPKKDEAAPAAPSSPRNITKNIRAATFAGDHAGDKIPSMRRTQTTPNVNVAAAASGRPSRSSNLKYSTTPTTGNEEEDSDDSSPGSPHETPQPARFTSKKYRVNMKEETDSDDDPRKPRIMTVELDEPSPSPRTSTRPARAAAGTRREESPRGTTPNGATFVETAPRSHRHRADVRSPPRRSNTFDTAGGTSKEALSKARHHHTSSNEGVPGGRLFGEVPSDGLFVPHDVSFAPRFGRDDVRFSELRRGSADSALPSRSDRDRDRERGDREKDRSDRERDRDRDRERDRDRDRDRDRERDRDSRRDRDRDHYREHRESNRERGKDDYAYDTRPARRGSATDRPGMGGRGASYTSVHV